MASQYMELGDEEEKFSLSGHKWSLSCKLKAVYFCSCLCRNTRIAFGIGSCSLSRCFCIYKAFLSITSSTDKQVVGRNLKRQHPSGGCCSILVSCIACFIPFFISFQPKDKGHVPGPSKCPRIVCIILGNLSLTSSDNGMITYSALM